MTLEVKKIEFNLLDFNLHFPLVLLCESHF